jgi:hypothetical protein
LWPFWFLQGYFGEAREWLERALALGDSPAENQAETLFAAGQFARLRGDYAVARSYGEEALRRSNDDGFRFGVGIAVFLLGTVAINLGEREEAASRFTETLAIFEEIGNARWIGSTLGYLASLALQEGDVGRYRSLSEEKLRVAQSIGDEWGGADALANLAEAALLEGELDRALALRIESLAARRRLGNLLGLLDELRAVASLASRKGSTALAIRLLGAEAVLREHAGIALAPTIRATHERQIAGLRTEIGAESFAALWSGGSSLSLDQAIAEAAAFAADGSGGAEPGA